MGGWAGCDPAQSHHWVAEAQGQVSVSRPSPPSRPQGDMRPPGESSKLFVGGGGGVSCCLLLPGVKLRRRDVCPAAAAPRPRPALAGVRPIPGTSLKPPGVLSGAPSADLLLGVNRRDTAAPAASRWAAIQSSLPLRRLHHLYSCLDVRRMHVGEWSGGSAATGHRQRAILAEDVDLAQAIKKDLGCALHASNDQLQHGFESSRTACVLLIVVKFPAPAAKPLVSGPN